MYKFIIPLLPKTKFVLFVKDKLTQDFNIKITSLC
jgi:hypothetical protein